MVDSAKMFDSQGSRWSDQELWKKGFDLIAHPSTRDKGFEQLIKLSRAAMSRYLRSKNGPCDDHHDIISNVADRIWESRNRREYPSLPAFFAFLKTAVRNELTDQRKSAHSRRTTSIESSGDPSDGHSTEFMQRLENLSEHHALLEVANNLWLGRKTPNFKYQMLAAKLLLWDRKRLSFVKTAVEELGCQQKAVDNASLISWVTEETILKRLSYAVIHHKPEKLVNTVTKDCNLASNEEVLLLWNRFFHLKPKKVLINEYPDNQREWAQSILDHYEARLPFGPCFEVVIDSVKRCGASVAVFARDELWKRTMFQYSLYKMPQEDMVTWFQHPTSLAQFNLGDGQIHGWIANKRLNKELREALESGEWS